MGKPEPNRARRFLAWLVYAASNGVVTFVVHGVLEASGLLTPLFSKAGGWVAAHVELVEWLAALALSLIVTGAAFWIVRPWSVVPQPIPAEPDLAPSEVPDVFGEALRTAVRKREKRAEYLEQHLSTERAEALRELVALSQRYKVSSVDEIVDGTRRLRTLVQVLGLDKEGACYLGRVEMHFRGLKEAQHVKPDTPENIAWMNDTIAFHHPMLAASVRALDKWLRGHEAMVEFKQAIANLKRWEPEAPAMHMLRQGLEAEDVQLIRTARYDKPYERPFRRTIKTDGAGGGP